MSHAMMQVNYAHRGCKFTYLFNKEHHVVCSNETAFPVYYRNMRVLFVVFSMRSVMFSVSQ